MEEKNNKIKIGVIFGGSSSEKEVSLEGGRNVFSQLNAEKYEKIPIFVDSKHKFWQIPETLIVQNTCEDLKKLAEKQANKIAYENLKNIIDFAFIIGHGKYMEDGCLQGLLELQNIPYNGPGILGATLGSDKYIQRQILTAAGINAPKHILVKDTEWQANPAGVGERIKKEIGLPCVSKPTREGCSTSITIINKEEQIKEGLEKALKWDRGVLVEELLEGTEITISIMGNEKLKALPITETPWGKNLGYLTLEDKFLPGGAEMITPARLSTELTEKAQEIAIKVCRILNVVGYPRVDMFVTNWDPEKKTKIDQTKQCRIVVLELNTLPGITPSTMVFHQAAEEGMTPGEFLDKIIKLGLAAHKNKKGPL